MRGVNRITKIAENLGCSDQIIVRKVSEDKKKESSTQHKSKCSSVFSQICSDKLAGNLIETLEASSILKLVDIGQTTHEIDFDKSVAKLVKQNAERIYSYTSSWLEASTHYSVNEKDYDDYSKIIIKHLSGMSWLMHEKHLYLFNHRCLFTQKDLINIIVLLVHMPNFMSTAENIMNTLNSKFTDDRHKMIEIGHKHINSIILAIHFTLNIDLYTSLTLFAKIAESNKRPDEIDGVFYNNMFKKILLSLYHDDKSGKKCSGIMPYGKVIDLLSIITAIYKFFIISEILLVDNCMLTDTFNIDRSVVRKMSIGRKSQDDFIRLNLQGKKVEKIEVRSFSKKAAEKLRTLLNSLKSQNIEVRRRNSEGHKTIAENTNFLTKEELKQMREVIIEVPKIKENLMLPQEERYCDIVPSIATQFNILNTAFKTELDLKTSDLKNMAKRRLSLPYIPSHLTYSLTRRSSMGSSNSYSSSKMTRIRKDSIFETINDTRKYFVYEEEIQERKIKERRKQITKGSSNQIFVKKNSYCFHPATQYSSLTKRINTARFSARDI